MDPHALNERGIKEIVAISLKPATLILTEIGTHYKPLPLAFPLLLITGHAQYGKKQNLCQLYLP